jgi:hypothetical protein
MVDQVWMVRRYGGLVRVRKAVERMPEFAPI